MESYKSRHITFKELIRVNDWYIKIYVITKTPELKNTRVYNHAINELPGWLEMKNSFNATHSNIGFLILHEGTEGVFSIINWWVGENMLNTHVFITDPKVPTEFAQISGDGLAPCVWELEIINYERLSWIKYVLKQASNPDFKSYLEDSITCEM